MSVCRSCGADIIWARTAAGKSMPLDAEPNPDGNVEILRYENSDLIDVVAVHKGPDLFGAERYMPHHASCPDAASWKGKR